MKNWQVMSGEKNWEGLIEPIVNDDLRRYIIHYGEMAQATYDAFDSDDNSKTADNNKYTMKELFSQVGLDKGRAKKKYIVTKFLYATATVPLFDKDTNWMGYVAVSTDEGKRELGRRDIVVAWRGTSEESEWVNNVRFFLVPASKIFEEEDHDSEEDKPEVHRGFYLIYTSNNPESTFCKTSVRDQVLEEVSRLVKKYEKENISVTVTGHSLGGALATLNAIDIAKNIFKDPNSSPPVTTFAFASPRVGDSKLRDSAATLNNLHILRIENKPDIVPDVPNVGYSDVGQVLMMDTRRSKYLKNNLLDPIQSITIAHNLEVYLHGVAGTQGINAEFKEKLERDIALVNKYDDTLKDEYGLPASWWDQPNKAGMVQQEDGSWKLINNKATLVSKL